MSPDASKGRPSPAAASPPPPHAADSARRVRLIDLVLSGVLKVSVTTPSAAPRR
jgi:hypothetical protein